MQQIAYSDTKQKHSDITKDHQSTVYFLNHDEIKVSTLLLLIHVYWLVASRNHFYASSKFTIHLNPTHRKISSSLTLKTVQNTTPL